jgi:hypothetical protein
MIPEPDSPFRIFAEAEMRHLLAREVQRCTRYQDFLSLCLVRTIPSGPRPAEPEAPVAHRIAEMLRATDFVGIIGADIVVLLVHTPDTDAVMITDRIRDRLQAGDPEEAGGLRIGLASFPTDATSDGGLLAHAEAQLQAARSD